MTPIEKGQQLIGKFFSVTSAVICVEEILNEQVRSDYLTEAAYNSQKQYWQQVLTYLKSKQ